MAKGRGNAYAAAMLLILSGLQSCSLWLQASAATYTVGGSQGWDAGVDYTTWAASQTFKVGDVLFFPYLEAQHDVVVVNKAGYDACSGANAIASHSEGNTNVTLSATGAHYYLCSVVGHCAAGMKLAVTVTATAAAPTAPPPATAPTPSKTPSSPPIKAPSAAPPSSSTRSSAPSPTSPAPAPTVEAPASAPTPSSPVTAPSVETPASPTAPGSTPSSSGVSSPPPPPPNAAPSLLTSACIAPLLTLLGAALFL